MISLEELQKSINNKILSVKMVKEDRMNFLRIEVLEPNLDKLTEISKEISNYLDSKEFSEKEYFLDIQSAGTEKPFILSEVKTRINKNVKVVLKRPLKDKVEFEGKLVEVEENKITISWNAKGQFRKQKIENENIKQIFDSAVIKKEK